MLLLPFDAHARRPAPPRNDAPAPAHIHLPQETAEFFSLTCQTQIVGSGQIVARFFGFCIAFGPKTFTSPHDLAAATPSPRHATPRNSAPPLAARLARPPVRAGFRPRCPPRHHALLRVNAAWSARLRFAI